MEQIYVFLDGEATYLLSGPRFETFDEGGEKLIDGNGKREMYSQR